MTKRPNLFILGAPKCGTTAIAQYLSDHPNIYMCDPKEPNFFTRDFPVYQQQFKDLEEYEQLFAYTKEQHHVVGEASVWYLYSATAVNEILKHYPDAKFIVMVRNPVDMATSLHSQMVLMREETVTDFAEAWALQKSRAQGDKIPDQCREPTFLQYRKTCSLGEQIERLLKITKGKNTKIVFFDDMTRDTRATYLKILNFLDIKDDGRKEFPVINSNRTFRSPLLQRAIIRAPEILRPIVKQLKRFLGIRRIGLLEKFVKINMIKQKRKPISSELHEQLISEFKEDISLLESLTAKDLSNWI